MVPLVFLIIIVTVTLYGVTAAPLARLLGLGGGAPDGVLILGAHRFGRDMARALEGFGVRVHLVDINRTSVNAAKRLKLPASLANAISPEFVEEYDEQGIGCLLALTPNDEVNTLGCLRYAERFGRDHVFQITPTDDDEAPNPEAIGPSHRGRLLFGQGVTLAALDARLQAGGRIHIVDLPLAADAVVPGPDAPRLFVITPERAVHFMTTDAQLPARGRLAYLGAAPPLADEAVEANLGTAAPAAPEPAGTT